MINGSPPDYLKKNCNILLFRLPRPVRKQTKMKVNIRRIKIFISIRFYFVKKKKKVGNQQLNVLGLRKHIFENIMRRSIVATSQYELFLFI